MLIIDKSRKLPVITVGALAAIALVAWLATGSSDPDPTAPGASVASSAGTAPAGAGTPSGTPNPLAPPAPPAFAQPVEDPASVFELGHNGGLVVDATTVTSLDRLQSALGENPTPDDIAKLEKQLREGLPKADADKAIKLLNGYREYSVDMRKDVMNLGIPQTREDADKVLASMMSAQARHFDPDSADAMFGAQNRLSRAVLDAALIQMDTSLSNEQKRERLAAVRATMPPEQRNAIPEVPAEPASAPA